MADILSVTHPDVFAAVGRAFRSAAWCCQGCHDGIRRDEGNATEGATRRRTRTRKIIFHGTADATVHRSNGERVFETARSDASGLQELTSTMNTNGRRATHTVLAAGSGPAVAEFWEIEGGGHAWSGGSGSGSYTDAGGPDASREMIRFFSRDAALSARRRGDDAEPSQRPVISDGSLGRHRTKKGPPSAARRAFRPRLESGRFRLSDSRGIGRNRPAGSAACRSSFPRRGSRREA